MVLSAPHKKHPPTQKKKHSHGILRRRHQSHQPPVQNREFGQNQKTLTSAVAVYPPWWVVDGSLPSLDGFWFQHVRERQGIITVTSLSLAPWSPFISPIVATGWNRQKQCESIGRVQRSWTTDAPFVCITYIYIQPKNYGSWNTNIIIDIYIYPVMYIPPHSTRSGTNPISTSLPKNKHSPTSQSLVRQHHETRCPPLFRPSFKLKSLENSGRRMLGRRWVVDSSTAMIIVDTLKGYLKSS